jgi:hypothetical protein
LSNGKPCLARALFEVTSGGVFWIVAVGPAKWAMRAFLLRFIASKSTLLAGCHSRASNDTSPFVISFDHRHRWLLRPRRERQSSQATQNA